MRFRFTSNLVLGLAVVMIGGCSCGERCRIPLLAKLQTGMNRKPCDCDNCSTTRVDCADGNRFIVNEPWYADQAVQSDQVTDMQQLEAPPEQEDLPERPPLEQPDVPQPPSKELKNGAKNPKLPDIKPAVTPDGDGAANPSLPMEPTRSTMLAPVVEDIQQPITFILDKNQESLSQDRNSVLTEDFNGPSTELVEPHASKGIASVENQLDETLDALQEDEVKHEGLNVLKKSGRVIKAVPISTSKTLTPTHQSEEFQPEEAVPGSAEERYGFDDLQLETLPAKSFDVPVPIVLRAVPNVNHAAIVNRVADLRGNDHFGQPVDETVFNDLPKLDEGEVQEQPVDFSDSDTPFEEPPADNRIPDFEPVSQFQSQPEIESESKGFTKPTSYQVPMENDASVLLDAASAVDCGLVDHEWDKNTWNNRRQNQLENHSQTTQQSIVRIVDPKQPPKQVQILRLRAFTPLDRKIDVPPVVSFRNVFDPVIVRGTHPEAGLPIAKQESAIPRIQARPTVNSDRLEASIRGLTSRPQVDPVGSNTIDR